MKQIIRRVAALVVGLGLGAVSLAGLESVTHISDLNASWPLGSDLASTSDDHIRNIKSALKTDFPNVNAAVNPTPAQFNQLTSNTFTSAVTGNSFIPSSSTVPANGIYLPAANTLGFSANTTKWGSVNSTGNWVFIAPSSGTAIVATAVSGAAALQAVGAGTTQVGQFDGGGSTGGNIESADSGRGNIWLFGRDNASTGNFVFALNNTTPKVSILTTGGVTIAAPSSGNALTVAAVSGTHSTKIADSANNSFNAGFLEVPPNGQSGNYTLVLSDSGKFIYHASGDGAGDTYTIPANASVAYPTGTVLTFINSDTNSVSIAITTDTQTLCGTTTTGTRTLAQNGTANAIKVTSTSWIICGTGLT